MWPQRDECELWIVPSTCFTSFKGWQNSSSQLRRLLFGEPDEWDFTPFCSFFHYIKTYDCINIFTYWPWQKTVDVTHKLWCPRDDNWRQRRLPQMPVVQNILESVRMLSMPHSFSVFSDFFIKRGRAEEHHNKVLQFKTLFFFVLVFFCKSWTRSCCRVGEQDSLNGGAIGKCWPNKRLENGEEVQHVLVKMQEEDVCPNLVMIPDGCSSLFINHHVPPFLVQQTPALCWHDSRPSRLQPF